MAVNREKIWRTANRDLKREDFYQENREWGEKENNHTDRKSVV